MTDLESLRRRAANLDLQPVTGTIWQFACPCGRVHEHKRRLVSVHRFNAVAALVRELAQTEETE